MGTRGSPAVTVLTPAYNRVDTLQRLHDSLVAQTWRDFEWVIVDDGSGEQVSRVVRGWIEAGDLDIVYRWQENQGKAAAVNHGVELARGEYTSIIDDDDRFVENALERLLGHWRAMSADEREGFSGVVGLCAFEDGTIVGDSYPSDPLDCDPVELSYVYRVRGDKHGLLRTDVLREFPYPFAGRGRHVIDAIVWHRMALKYRERHVNEVVTIKEYRPEGITARERGLLIESAPATRQFFLEEAALPHGLPRRTRARSYVNFARYSHHAGVGIRRQLREVRSRPRLVLTWPVGYGLYLRDRRRMAASRRIR
jgi:glycosyltransferase involved in cell wall biosynthesis